MGKIITVTSGKGGTGKTTTVAAMSSCLAALGYKTLCIDFDSGLKNLDLALCMTDFAVADFMDVVSGRLDLMEACHESPQIPNLFFLAAPAEHITSKPDARSLYPMFNSIRHEFEYCFIDSPSGIGSGFRLASAGADMSLIVTAGEMPAIRDAQQVALASRDMGIGELRLLINRVSPKNFKLLKGTIDDVINAIGVRLVGVIPEDPAIFRALHENIPLILYKKRLSVYEFLDAARRIAGADVPLRMR